MREEYLRYLRRVRGLSSHTLEGYAHDLSLYDDYLSRERIDAFSVTPRQARGYVASLSRNENTAWVYTYPTPFAVSS